MRAVFALMIPLVIALASACAETERCPDGEVFDREGRCVPIPARDAGTTD
jgi:hypothetical protein